MKKIITIILLLCCILCTSGCSSPKKEYDIVATTRPVYDITVSLCQNTGLSIKRLVTENLSCLHNYTLQVNQMQAIESADLIVLSGVGMEDFLHNALQSKNHIIDSSQNVNLLCHEHTHTEDQHDGHHHSQDPHIWLSVDNARIMAQNIYSGLCAQYPNLVAKFQINLQSLQEEFDALELYGQTELQNLRCRELITFHDGFSYFADDWDLHILYAVEEESGSEASAAQLIMLTEMVTTHQLPAIFTETNGSTSAAGIIASETGAKIFTLNMAMSEKDYFESMYYNIDTIKEALG